MERFKRGDRLHRTGDSISLIELLNPETWETYLYSGNTVLILSSSNCVACEEWKLELSQWASPEDIRIAEIKLDQPRFGRFKSTHPWVADIDILPFNAIFIDGEVVKRWAGGGISRLENRLQRFMS